MPEKPVLSDEFSLDKLTMSGTGRQAVKTAQPTLRVFDGKRARWLSYAHMTDGWDEPGKLCVVYRGTLLEDGRRVFGEWLLTVTGTGDMEILFTELSQHLRLRLRVGAEAGYAVTSVTLTAAPRLEIQEGFQVD